MQGEKMTCPDQECHSGKEKMEKCVEKLKNESVKKSTSRWIVGLCVAVMISAGGYSLNASAKEKDKRTENTKQIEVIKNDIEHIKDSVKKIEGKQMTPQQLLELMKQAIKESK